MRIEYRLKDLKLDQVFDLVIIGAGINGAGVARDAAERGLKVLLLEKNDFGSGCSAHSTRLIHGGLRYLEFFEFGLVKESLTEREILLKQYPHLVNPIGLMIPAYQRSKRGLMQLNLGMWLYDWLSRGKSLENYKSFSKHKLEGLNVGISKDKLKGAVYYFDAQVPLVERLVLENIFTAQKHGAICLNHCEVSDIICDLVGDKYQVKQVRFKDSLNGKLPYTVKAHNVINLSGPWVDQLNTRIKKNDNFPVEVKLKQRIGGTKGSHIVVRKFRGAPSQFGIYNEAQSDGRPFFILPYKVGMNEDLYLIGTTDIFIDKDSDIDKLTISDKEISYLINEVNLLFPQAQLDRSHIVKTFAGLRPLPSANKKSNEGKITRRHFVVNHSKEYIKNYYSIVGGKITTFRNLSKELVDLFTTVSCSTEVTKTIGCQYPSNLDFYSYLKQVVKEYSHKYDVNVETILHLIMIYGTQAEKVLELCLTNPKLKNKVEVGYEDIEAQIVYAIRYEAAYTIDDIVRRRLSIGLCTDNISTHIVAKIKSYLQEEFELVLRERDKIIEKVLFSDYNH